MPKSQVPNPTPAELRAIARARLDDARALLKSGRFDGAVYLCGYAVELTLKARICSRLKWSEYPSKSLKGDFQEKFKIHHLDALLFWTGRESKIKTIPHRTDWDIVGTWDPTVRYRAVGSAKRTDAEEMLRSAAALMGVL